MKWRPPPARVQEWLVAPIAYPLAAILAVLLSHLIVMSWLDGLWRKHQRAKGRHVWFAWHPVRFNAFWYDDVPTQWFWLEKVERRLNGDGWQYWPVGFSDPYE